MLYVPKILSGRAGEKSKERDAIEREGSVQREKLQLVRTYSGAEA